MDNDVAYFSFKQVIDKTTTVTVGSLGAILLFTFIIQPYAEPIVVWSWFGFMVLQQLARQAYSKYLLNHQRELKANSAKYINRYFIFIIITALGWSSLAPLYLHSESSAFAIMYVTIFVLGITAASITALSTVPKYFFTYTALVVFPTIVSFLFLEYYYLACVILVFYLYAFKSSLYVLRSVRSNLLLNIKNNNLIEDLKTANQLKSDFLANMSHEIRTPMNAILGFLDLLQDGERDPKKIEYFKTITHSGQDLLQIVDDILDFSKIENNQYKIEKIPFSIKKRMTEIVQLFNNQAQYKKIKIELNISESVPEMVKTDPTRLMQMVNNLVSNAIKFSAEYTTVKITVEYRQENQVLQIHVKDQGIGISKEKLEHIFKPFRQADSSTTRKFGGTGLGLSICTGLAEKLGGKVTVESVQGVGSTFHICIEAPEVKQVTQSSTSKKQPEALQGHVLIVEDNKTNQMLVTKLTEKMGLTYDMAEDGHQAVEMFKINKYDLILMDENMPNLNGIEATARIRELEKRDNNKASIIIAVTANSLKGDKEKFMQAGMNDYLSKPINIPQFYSMLTSYLK